MIYTETVTINGYKFTRTYSDTYTIQRDGVEYTEAVDPVDSGRIYTETAKLLPVEEQEPENPAIPEDDEDATIEDYKAALADLWVE